MGHVALSPFISSALVSYYEAFESKCKFTCINAIRNNYFGPHRREVFQKKFKSNVKHHHLKKGKHH